MSLFFMVLVSALLWAAPCFALQDKPLTVNVIRSFTSEEPIRKPMKLPPAIMHILAAYENGELARCQADASMRKKNPADHFSAISISLGTGSPNAILVQARTPCFMGAHNTAFWLFDRSQSEDTYHLVLDVSSDSLDILQSQTQGYHDIVITSHTVSRIFTRVWKYDGKKERYVESDEAYEESAVAPAGETPFLKTYAVIRAQFVQRGVGDKYVWDKVKVLELIKNETDYDFSKELSVARYSWDEGMDENHPCTLYLAPYPLGSLQLNAKQEWMLLGGKASTGAVCK